MKKRLLKLMLVIMALTIVSPGLADSITIENHSFELPGSGEEICDFGDIPGWNGPSGDDTCINSWDGGSTGSWCCSLGPNDGYVYQLTGHAIAVGDYELKIDAQTEGTLLLELYYGSTTLASESWPIAGDYSTKTLTKTVSGGDPAIGQTLGVRFKNTQNDSWTVVDNVRLTYTADDTDPPTPDPATWAQVPSADSDTVISMTATTATDPSGVEYFFDETSGNPGGSDSAWQTDTGYTDSGLNPGTQYCYQVKARDLSSNQNETAWSTNECAETNPPDPDPPTPDPMTWAAVPAAVNSSAIEMTATTATDLSGVEYYFAETSANPGGSDSGWRDSTIYTDAGLNAETQYCYEVQARDKSANQNATAWSTNECATTPVAPPLPTVVYPSGGSDAETLAAKEVRRYIYMRTDQLLAIQGVASLPPSGELILVCDEDDPLLTGLSLGDSTGPNGFIIKSINSGGRDILVITGNDSTATLHAAYRYAEHLGCGFDLAEDAIPDAKITLDITGLDEKAEPLFPTNGFLPFHDFFHGPDIWSTDDYKSFISQIAKLGMNFIGLHTYPTWSTTEEKTGDVRQGPEPHIWIGLQGDYDSSGNVSWSYPGYYRHTACPHNMWGHQTLDTDQFRSGTAQLFDRNEWGSDIFGNTMPSPTDMAAWNQVWNNSGQMLKEAFGHAKTIGVKTCLGTELTMGLEPEGPEVGYDWARVMPQEVQDRVADPYDAATVRSVYKAVFDRIMKTHDLDYYWLWSWEVWSLWGVDNGQISAFKDDMNRAQEALAELGNPFQICHAGWKLGTVDNPDEFDTTFPYEAPFCGLWDAAEGFEYLHADRVKWPATWLEEDWGLGQPQLEGSRVYVDVKAAWDKSCDGMIAKHWRTKSLLANAVCMKDILWCYGPTGTPISKGVPSNQASWLDAVYLDWATRHFGPEAASSIANIISPIDNAGEGAIPGILEWEGPPGAIKRNSASWSTEQSKYTFVDDLVALRPSIVGTGNLARYDYLLDCMESYKRMAEYGCVRDDYLNAISGSNWSTALTHRRAMARLFEQFQTMFIERTVNATDLGAIIHHELVNWYQLVEMATDSTLEYGLGGPIPSDAYPTSSYLGSAFVKVVPALTQVNDGEALTLKVLIMDTPTSATLYYRPLGGSSYTDIALTNVARNVYEVTIPAQSDDFEYYIDAVTPIGNATFPVTAPTINQTVVVLGEAGPPDTDPPTPDPMTWASVPTADDHDSISMTATTATDPSGVEYYFDETTGGPGGSDSGWQADPGYTDDGLSPSTQYCYEVTARDKSVNQNTTAASSNECATTDAPDTTPPTPDPMTWASVPASGGTDNISMVATTATDPSGVSYYFDEITGNPGGSDSGWQPGTSYNDDGLSQSTTYTYTVTARDNSVNLNETAASTDESATTDSGPVFADNFESATDWTNNWTAYGAWNRVTAKSYDGSYSAEIDGNVTDSALVSVAIDVAGKDDATVTFAWLIESGLDAGEYLRFDVDTGSGWVQKASLDGNVDTENVWHNESIPVDVSAAGTMSIRFRGKMSGQNEDAYVDVVEVTATGGAPDTTPPTPDPMTWASAPSADGDSAISMTATTATDVSGVEYYFDETSGNPGGSDSVWQDGTYYQDDGLNAGTQYCYEVAARDKSVNQNETAASSNQCATTTAPDTDPPTPDPMTWSSVPAADSSSAISMTATTATDPSGVSYYFDETSGNPGGSDSSWQPGTGYTDDGLDAGTQYAYQVKARDNSANQNETAWSTPLAYATTDAGCSPTDCHVEAMVCSEQSCGGPNRNGVATVTIYDDCGDPVVGADVTGTFTGSFSEQVMDTTDGNGVAVLVSTGCLKKPTFQVCVDDVDHTLPYDSNDNLVTCCND